jgi:heat-inducible transcriptional repressor
VIYRDGLSEIISAFSDGMGAQQAVRLFEERAFMDMLLSEVLQPLDSESNIQVIIAGNGRWEELNRLSMVLTRYGVEGQMSGAMGVLGPTNLNYGRAIHAVRHVANVMTNRLVMLYSDEPPKLDESNS